MASLCSPHFKPRHHDSVRPGCVDAMTQAIAAAKHEPNAAGVRKGSSEFGGVGCSGPTHHGAPAWVVQAGNEREFAGTLVFDSAEPRIPAIPAVLAFATPHVPAALEVQRDEAKRIVEFHWHKARGWVSFNPQAQRDRLIWR